MVLRYIKAIFCYDLLYVLSGILNNRFFHLPIR